MADALPPIHVGDLLWVWWEHDGWFVGRVRHWGHWQHSPPLPHHVWCRMADGEDTPVDLLKDVWSLTPPEAARGGADVWKLDMASMHNLEPPPHVQLHCRQMANERRMGLRSAVKLQRVQDGSTMVIMVGVVRWHAHCSVGLSSRRRVMSESGGEQHRGHVSCLFRR